MHSWSEVEHDLVYKPLQGELSEDEYAILDELNGLVLAGEIALERLQRAVETRVAQEGSTFSSHFELASFLLKATAPILKSGVNESALGRVDTLYELLLTLDLNTPEKIRSLISNLHSEVEKRSISDQIIDQVVASDAERYKIYAKIRGKNEHEAKSASEATVFGEFMKNWVEFEKILTTASQAQGMEDHKPLFSRRLLDRFAGLDSEQRKQIEWIWMLRNRAVHGHGEIDINEMREATKLLKKIIKKLSRDAMISNSLIISNVGIS
jgi:hypothetical protein